MPNSIPVAVEPRANRIIDVDVIAIGAREISTADYNRP